MDHPESSEFKNLVTVEKYNRWKRMRLVINPSFSAAKIREVILKITTCLNIILLSMLRFLPKMGPLLDTCVDRLLEQFEETEKEIDIKG